MKPKIVNADDHDVLNPMANTSHYGAGTEDGIPRDLELSDTGEDDEEDDLDEDDLEEDEEAGDDEMIEGDEALPGEIADPEGLDDDDEAA